MPSAPPVGATPLDKTPPATPTEVTVTADEVLGNLQVTWVKVQRDVLGHVDPAVAVYRVYRYETAEDVAAPNVQVALVPHVPGGATTLTAVDADPGLGHHADLADELELLLSPEDEEFLFKS